MDYFSQNFREFIELLSVEDATPRIITKALSVIADDLGIGKCTLDINIPPCRESPKGEQSFKVIYEFGGGFADSNRYIYRTETSNNGVISYTFFTRGETDWIDEDKQNLDLIAWIMALHSARFQLLNIAQRASMTQYQTGLPNSGGYLMAVGRIFAMGNAAQYDAYCFNIKGMGLFNIKFGQFEGGEIIKRYARLLMSKVQEDEVLGHLGGDNFVAFIKKENAGLFEELLSGAETWAMRRDERIPITISCMAGVMRVDERTDGPWMVMNGPMVAYQNAKQSQASLVVLTPDMLKRASRVQEVENAFRNALKAEQFVPYFQPKVNMLTGEIVGAEVLSRWVVDGRVIPPAEYIPILEKTGEIVELDIYMLSVACREMKRWKDNGGGNIPLSVNISRRDLDVPDLAAKILSLYDEHGVDHGDIIIEVTETENARESSIMMAFLNELTKAGVKTSIDDFGTGYSSLSFLRDFPVCEIKIDRSFINHDTLREKDKTIIGSIINMAVSLGINVITEGVEVTDQVNFLLDLDCHQAQGFLYDQPLPLSIFEERLKSGPYKI
ncbi:MAG: GGDEF domain-containing phosphodiesterase [Lachnospiraceae bacterium]|nr:GGDEF domain-containing phosphodiesterase [Lachnospiraceae bacterium]